MDFKNMFERSKKIGIDTEGESAFPADLREEIENVRARARAEGKDEDEAVREFHELRAQAEKALKETEEDISEELKKAA